MEMQLTVETSARWLAMAPVLFKRAVHNTGRAQLPGGIRITYLTKHGEVTVECPEGTGVYFPPVPVSEKKNPNSVRPTRNVKRVVSYCIIYAPTHHITLVIVGNSLVRVKSDTKVPTAPRL